MSAGEPGNGTLLTGFCWAVRTFGTIGFSAPMLRSRPDAIVSNISAGITGTCGALFIIIIWRFFHDQFGSQNTNPLILASNQDDRQKGKGTRRAEGAEVQVASIWPPEASPIFVWVLCERTLLIVGRS
jgi:hypothetical protein